MLYYRIGPQKKIIPSYLNKFIKILTMIKFHFLSYRKVFPVETEEYKKIS